MDRLILYSLIASSTTCFSGAFVPFRGDWSVGQARVWSTANRETRASTPLSMVIRAVETYNGDFTLEEQTANTLDKYLRHPDMISEVCKQFDCQNAEFTGDIFQPVPYSLGTPQGMPADIEEKYFLNLEYGIANIPPVVMFNAKIFKPSRLCAVYRVEGLSEAAQEATQERIRRVRDQEKRKKEESDRVDAWDDIGSTITEVFETPFEDEDVDLDSMVV